LEELEELELEEEEVVVVVDTATRSQLVGEDEIECNR
jgi:hypothetical protein